MEEDCTVKPSVAELAGRFKGHSLPMPTANEEKRPIRRIPPCSLNFQNKKDDDCEPEKPAIVSPIPKGKLKNSPLFEKIQANLALSPTASPLSPEVKLQPTPFAPIGSVSPCSPLSPTLRAPPLQTHISEEEVPVSFEQPAEGTTLPSINKCRPRLSFKRRPPTRQHRKSASEDSGFSPSDEPNGDGADVFDGPSEGQSSPQPSVVKETSEEEEEGVKDITDAHKPAESRGQDTEQKALVETDVEAPPEEQKQELDIEEEVMEERQQVEEGAAETTQEGSTPDGGESNGKN